MKHNEFAPQTLSLIGALRSAPRVGINARFLTKPFTGIGQHTKYLFSALAALHPELKLVMVTP